MSHRRQKPLRYAAMCNASSLSDWETRCLHYLDGLELPPQLVLRIWEATRAVVPDYSKRSFFEKVRSVGLRNVGFHLANKHLLRAPQSVRSVEMSTRFQSADSIYCTSFY